MGIIEYNLSAGSKTFHGKIIVNYWNGSIIWKEIDLRENLRNYIEIFAILKTYDLLKFLNTI